MENFYCCQFLYLDSKTLYLLRCCSGKQSRQTNWKSVWNANADFAVHDSFCEICLNFASFFCCVFFSLFYYCEWWNRQGNKKTCLSLLALSRNEWKQDSYIKLLFCRYRKPMCSGCRLEKWFWKEKDNGIAGFTAKGRKILRSRKEKGKVSQGCCKDWKWFVEEKENSASLLEKLILLGPFSKKP